MEIIKEQTAIRLKNVDSFKPLHIFECGQAFRWSFDGYGYVGVVKDRVIRIIEEGTDIILENSNIDDFHNIWKKYFDLDRDYSLIKKQLATCDSIMKKAISFGHGIRILNQDPWETLISFIISANNNIDRIGKTIENICRVYGDKLIWQGKAYYTFPSPQILANGDMDILRKCGCGYRDKYILSTANMVAADVNRLYELRNLPYDEAFEYLLEFPGVGPKVADCVLLFSLGKSEAFPVDVWIRRIVEYLYFNGEDINSKDLKRLAMGKFGDLAGFAQQYLFYYARENNIGK